MSQNQPVFGVLNIDKPAGITSHDVVAQVRKILKEQDSFYKKIKVGHTGTLDPFATGVLLVVIGQATRLIEYSHDWDKEYEAALILGSTSDTDDVTGIIKKSEILNEEILNKSEIIKILNTFVGKIGQRPPAYSAIKVKGERAYDLARKGKEVSLNKRKVTIKEIKLIAFKYPELIIKVSCSTGTYMRSLGRDVGEELGTGAYVKQLRRTRIGEQTVENSVKLGGLSFKQIKKHLMPAEYLVEHLSKVTLSEVNVAQFIKGISVGKCGVLSSTSPKAVTTLVAVYKEEGAKIIGIGQLDETSSLLHPKKVLC